MRTIHLLFSGCITLCFTMVANNSMSQAGTTCATAWAIPVDSCTGIHVFIDVTLEGATPSSSCTSGFESEGWYSFTVPAGPNQNINIAATDSYGSNGFAIQALSGNCGSQVEIGCANNFAGIGFQSEFLSLSNLSPGTYYIRIINDGGTAGTRVNVCVSAASVGVSEIINEDILSIYPNPFASETTISFKSEVVNAVISVRDLSGKEVKTINFSGKQLKLEKNEIEPGIYFVQITGEQKIIANKKILIQ